MSGLRRIADQVRQTDPAESVARHNESMKLRHAEVELRDTSAMADFVLWKGTRPATHNCDVRIFRNGT